MKQYNNPPANERKHILNYTQPTLGICCKNLQIYDKEHNKALFLNSVTKRETFVGSYEAMMNSFLGTGCVSPQNRHIIRF